MAIHFEIVRSGNLYSVTADNVSTFEVGTRVSYGSEKSEARTFGLANDGSTFARQCLYTADSFSGVYSFWANFIEPTAICEGQSFITLNTYDRAHFTFGFAQFAAHVPDGDFVLWFRDLLGLADSQLYFPDLEIRAGRINKISGPNITQLEDDQSTQGLMTYLNPTLTAVEDEEVIAAARFIFWTMQNPSTRDLQVSRMKAVAQSIVRTADKRLGLDGKSALVCCIIFDVLHQGRAQYSDMQRALLAADPVSELLQLGSTSQPARCANLGAALTPARRALLSSRSWSSVKQDFD